ncbi:MAG: hypothetical protein K6C32_01325 [Bacilli bacterium]|nr:hypothetical protein [Bacilli bacterium]
MKKICKLFLPLIALMALPSCNNKMSFAYYDKMISDVEFFSTRGNGELGKDYHSLIHFQVDQDRSFHFYYYDESVNPKINWYCIRKLPKYGLFSFSYDYLCPENGTYIVKSEKVKIAVYTITDCKDANGQQFYFMYGYNLPRIIATNEKIDNTFIEKHKITEAKTDNSGKEFSVKSYPDFGGYELVKRHSPDAQWQDQEVNHI